MSLHSALAETAQALSLVDGSGLLGRPIGALADSAHEAVADLTAMAGAVDTAMPDMADALGAGDAQRYLVAALNDAELFGSGGAPLSAFVVEAAKGTLSVPISGQMESKLSPNNPPIKWRKEGGRPWYRDRKKYPFVNSNFHPDFRTASVDMRRAWASLGYPEVDGVITVDINALASILAWTGAVDTGWLRDGHVRTPWSGQCWWIRTGTSTLLRACSNDMPRTRSSPRRSSHT